jgi:16S rRNA pseudouridine516 synthase
MTTEAWRARDGQCTHGTASVPRLDDLLARNLGCSRTAAAHLIQEGQVRDAAGTVLLQRRAEIAADALPVTVVVQEKLGKKRRQGLEEEVEEEVKEERQVVLHDATHLMLNKPLGVVTALRDERHPTAFDLVQGAPLPAELRAVGRLDLDTSGLLLWTTDGQWVQRLTHPKRKVPRTYQAALARPFRDVPPGFTLDDGHQPTITTLQVIQADVLHPSLVVPPETTVFATITVIGGAYHEIRRIFAALGSHVLGLCRVAFGRLALPVDLAPGTYVDVDLTQV